MSAPISARLSQSLSLQANVSYELLGHTAPDGHSIPVQLGSGKFAKVYKAWQRSARRNVRKVAVKILHDYATLADERLFKQEIDLLKELTTVDSVNVIRTLDIVHLTPLLMCGCGVVYHPLCPKGCGLPLSRIERVGHDYPLLHCARCGYELSGEDVQQRGAELGRAPAKTCCTSGPRATQATLLNFVEREVVVMELVEHGLLDLQRLQSEELGKLGLSAPSSSQSQRGPLDSSGTALPVRESLWQRLLPDRESLLLQRVSLLQKLYLMVQLAEAVAWLHGEKRIIHKDLAPDNILISHLGDEGGVSDWRGESQQRPRERLEALASFPRFGLKVIDFGLADKDELSRSWYEEQDVVASAVKMPYTSPEARRRKERINEAIEVDKEAGRFRVPRALMSTYLSVLPGDLLADTRDVWHDHDLEILRLEPDGQTGDMLAYFRGTPAAQAGRHYELVRRMGEPHDIYAVGALFYYILTGRHEEVDRTSSLVNLLQEDQQRELSLSALGQDKYYIARRSAIPEPFFRDELMMLILRAMVRGRPQSFVRSRMDRGPQAAQQLLAETQRLYHAVQRELHSAPLRQQVVRAVAIGAPTLVALLAMLGLRSCGGP